MAPEELIKALYNAILDRDPDPEGFKLYLQSLADGSVSLDEIIRSFLDSPEFSRKIVGLPGLQGMFAEIFSAYPKLKWGSQLSSDIYVEFASAYQEATDDAIINWIGDIYPVNSFPVLPSPKSWKSPAIPIPSDGFRADEVEWFAFCFAIQYSRACSRSPIVMAELGCSQGLWCLPWVKQSVKNDYHAIAYGYEASSSQEATISFWRSNFLEALSCAPTENGGLRFDIKNSSSSFHWFNNAVSATSGQTIYFPRVDCSVDNGAELVIGQGLDASAFVSVETISLSDILARCGGFLDFLHIDIQGAELGIVNTGGFSCLSEAASVVLIGTHSLPIHLAVYAAMMSLGFRLVSSSPPAFDSQGSLRRDGEQLWVSQDAFDYGISLSLLKEHPFPSDAIGLS